MRNWIRIGRREDLGGYNMAFLLYLRSCHGHRQAGRHCEGLRTDKIGLAMLGSEDFYGLLLAIFHPISIDDIQ